MHYTFQVCYMRKTLATTPLIPYLVTMATLGVAQDQQIAATTPPNPIHLSAAEVLLIKAVSNGIFQYLLLF